MKNKISVLLVFVLVLAWSSEVLAQSVPDRIAGQQYRINQGVRRGDLTRHEAESLNANLDYIRGEYEKARAEGTLRYERRRIISMLAQNSRMIYNRRHNPVRRLW